MSKSTPSLLALLGLVAVAGYQNRDKISDMLADARRDGARAGDIPNGSGLNEGGGLLSEIGRMFQGGLGGSTLASGLSDLVNQFKSAGRGDPADSWVADGPNMPVDISELEQILGQDTLDELSTKTGMPREQLLQRLNAALPDVVNRLTPQGRVPTAAEAQSLAEVY